MTEVFGDGVFASLPDEQQYTVDPADPLAGEVWVQTDNTVDHLDLDADLASGDEE